MASALLALAASVAWGLGDFAGGLISRRLPVASVTLLQHAAGLATVVVIAVALRAELSRQAVAVGALGGVFSAGGILSYYRALSIGTMSIVSPLAACGAVVTVAASLADGERPSAMSLTGGVVALSGAVLASFHEHGRGGASREAVLLALVTAFMFGMQLYFLGRASDEGGPISAILGARVVSAGVIALLVWGLWRRRVHFSHPGFVAGIVGTGVLVATANALYGLAAERGLISIASVLASLYPVTTVLLAYLALRERLNRTQVVGVVVALTGVTITVLG
ncbi:MAG: DMT family transporter [Actinomycetota bacterium]|nr:DMT family transporter [Actinomycetota bacterium]